jgi:hypothetical protein
MIHALADKYLKLLRNYQGYYLVALLIISDDTKKYQQSLLALLLWIQN